MQSQTNGMKGDCKHFSLKKKKDCKHLHLCSRCFYSVAKFNFKCSSMTNEVLYVLDLP